MENRLVNTRVLTDLEIKRYEESQKSNLELNENIQPQYTNAIRSTSQITLVDGIEDTNNPMANIFKDSQTDEYRTLVASNASDTFAKISLAVENADVFFDNFNRFDTVAIKFNKLNEDFIEVLNKAGMKITCKTGAVTDLSLTFSNTIYGSSLVPGLSGTISNLNFNVEEGLLILDSYIIEQITGNPYLTSDTIELEMTMSNADAATFGFEYMSFGKITVTNSIDLNKLDYFIDGDIKFKEKNLSTYQFSRDGIPFVDLRKGVQELDFKMSLLDRSQVNFIEKNFSKLNRNNLPFFFLPYAGGDAGFNANSMKVGGYFYLDRAETNNSSYDIFDTKVKFKEYV